MLKRLQNPKSDYGVKELAY